MKNFLYNWAELSGSYPATSKSKGVNGEFLNTWRWPEKVNPYPANVENRVSS